MAAMEAITTPPGWCWISNFILHIVYNVTALNRPIYERGQVQSEIFRTHIML